MAALEVDEFRAPDGVADGAAESREVVSVLCSAFFDYPVMRYVLGSGLDYADRLMRLVRFFVAARVLRGESIFCAWNRRDNDLPELAGAALVSRPSNSSPHELSDLREQTWSVLGHEARERYEAFGAVAANFATPPDFVRLNMIGVPDTWQGKGVGRALLDRVHQVSAADPESAGVALTTEVPSNVALYRHFGYEVVGAESVTRELTTWGMFRSDLRR